MLIDQSATICTVIVTVDGEAEDLEFVAGHASEGLEQFSQFDGFIAGATHISEDGERVIQYLQWESEEAHEACMEDPSWAEDESSQKFMELMESGDITVDVRIYDIVAESEEASAVS